MIKTLVLFATNILTFIFIHNRFTFLRKYPQGWGRLTAYAIGVLFTFPFFIVHIIHREKPENAYMLAFLGSGIGTAFGWMFEDTSK